METNVNESEREKSSEMCARVCFFSLTLVDLIFCAQPRQPNRFPFEEMANVLLDAMQSTLVCLDNHHIIIDVSKTVKQYFGFEQVWRLFLLLSIETSRVERFFLQAEIVGLSILLLVEDSERDLFFKFLSSTSQREWQSKSNLWSDRQSSF